MKHSPGINTSTVYCTVGHDLPIRQRTYLHKLNFKHSTPMALQTHITISYSSSGLNSWHATPKHVRNNNVAKLRKFLYDPLVQRNYVSLTVYRDMYAHMWFCRTRSTFIFTESSHNQSSECGQKNVTIFPITRHISIMRMITGLTLDDWLTAQSITCKTDDDCTKYTARAVVLKLLVLPAQFRQLLLFLWHSRNLREN
jgi:hypothetical protein